MAPLSPHPATTSSDANKELVVQMRDRPEQDPETLDLSIKKRENPANYMPQSSAQHSFVLPTQSRGELTFSQSKIVFFTYVDFQGD